MLLMQISSFIKAFINNPAGVSTIFPASKSLSVAMSTGSEIAQRFNIVEIGVGTGALTAAMLNDMGDQHTYTGFEIDKTFFNYLGKNFTTKHKAQLDGLKAYEFKTNSAESLSDFFKPNSVDVVVSSLPWSVLDSDLQTSILTEVHKVLKPGGIFSFYNFVTGSQFSAFKRFKKSLEHTFSSVAPQAIVWASLPPATVWVAKK